MNRWLLFGHFLRYTRPSQMRERAWLMARRKAMVRLARRAPARPSPAARSLPPLAPDPPPPIFPPRVELVEREGDATYVRLLGTRRELTVPMEWHPADLDHDHLGKLNLHYLEYLEGLPDGLWPRVVDDWIAHNPPYRPAYWLDNWNSFALSIRCVVWMQRQAAAPIADAATTEALRASLVAQLRFLRRNLEVDIRGNHLVKNIKALLWAGRFFDGDEAGRWRALGERLLLRELGEQVLGDGVHFERSPAYHTQVFADFLECHHVLRPGPARTALADALDRMAQATADLTHPDGGISLFNDGGLHMVYPTATCLEVYTALTGKSVSPRPAFALSDAGYFGFRSETDYVLADCGPVSPDFLPAHAHGDILAFEWTRLGRRIFVDAGVSEYKAGPWRQYARSTRAHNTVTVGDEDQCEFWGSFRMGRRARVRCHDARAWPLGLELEGSHDGYRRLRGAPRHRRRLEATPGRIRVDDVVEGGAGQPVRARLLCHPDCRVEDAGGGTVRIENGGVVATVRSASPVAIEEAWWCPDFGVRLPAKQVVLHYGEAPCRGSFEIEAGSGSR